ncbi:MAG: hypothetical protein KGP35_06910 [Bacteroidetes bacterium]|nr:hypothetical protein [Bacteroidota bacterium]
MKSCRCPREPGARCQVVATFGGLSTGKKVTNRHPACPVAKRLREAEAKDLLMEQSSIDEMFRYRST